MKYNKFGTEVAEGVFFFSLSYTLKGGWEQNIFTVHKAELTFDPRGQNLTDCDKGKKQC